MLCWHVVVGALLYISVVLLTMSLWFIERSTSPAGEYKLANVIEMSELEMNSDFSLTHGNNELSADAAAATDDDDDVAEEAPVDSVTLTHTDSAAVESSQPVDSLINEATTLSHIDSEPESVIPAQAGVAGEDISNAANVSPDSMTESIQNQVDDPNVVHVPTTTDADSTIEDNSL